MFMKVGIVVSLTLSAMNLPFSSISLVDEIFGK
jgi:hypothetical protein